ncbi:MAG: hypothetical protein JNK82_40665 [Myxococcaceae bacterium]|nr:hypothetical protein [Myxococcaceae bacterium]
MPALAAVHRALTPLDGARRSLLKRVAGRWLADREARVTAIALFSIATALAGAVLLPLWVLALGPILLGVPHLAADVRYLVLRPGLHRRRALWLACGLPLLAVTVTGDIAPGFLAVAGAFTFSEGHRVRRALGIVASFAAFAAALVWRTETSLAFAWGHNVVAVALWWAWRPRRSLLPLALLAAVTLAVLFGAFDALPHFGAPGAFDFETQASRFAPNLEATLTARLLVCFAFAQSVHYAVWLRLVPDDDRERPAPRTFRASFDALLHDFGSPALAVCLLLLAGLAVWSAFDLWSASLGYFRLALFHGHLELAATAVFVTSVRSSACSSLSSRVPRASS